MRRMLLSLCLMTTALAAGAQTQMPQPTSQPQSLQTQIPAQSRQLILVVSPGWQDISAKLYRFERANEQSPWNQVAQPIQTVLGKKGMGWGRGLHQDTDTNGDYRVEFDKRTPAGIFSLGEVFGLASEKQARSWLGGLKMPYIELSESMRCIGDHQSEHYNEIVDIRQTKSDWNDEHNENMHQIAVTDEKAYLWGVFINHNVNSNPIPRDKVSGSCLFLHIWKAPDIGTAGCTAMTREHMVEIVRWLDQARQPILVQLPQSEYQRLKGPWALPAL